MKKISKNHLKKIQLDLLLYIDKVCQENNINYFINYGTLLGAVRHKGYIPWDDDIDISMYREDYNKFIQVIESQKHEKYKLLYDGNSDWYSNNFMVLLDTTTRIPDYCRKKRNDTSVFIDIFPIDCFDNEKIIKKIAILHFLKRITSLKKQEIINKDGLIKDLIRKILWYALYFVNPKIFTKKINKFISKNTGPSGKYEGFICEGNQKEVFKRGTYTGNTELYFENFKFIAPQNYHEILKQLYGNYMEYPSEVERNNHGFEAYLVSEID